MLYLNFSVLKLSRDKACIGQYGTADDPVDDNVMNNAS